MDSVNRDFAQFAGKYYPIVVDRASGYTMVAATLDETIDTALKYLKLLGNTYGFPSEVCSDGEPAFRCRFEAELSKLGISHHTSHCTFPPAMVSRREVWVS